MITRRGAKTDAMRFFALLFCAIGVWIAASAVGAAGAQLLSGSSEPVSTTQNNRSPFGIDHPRHGGNRQGSNLPERALVLEHNMKNQDAGAAAPAVVKMEPPEISDLAAIVLADIWDRYTAMDFEEAIANIAGLTELIGENSRLGEVVRDLDQMIRSELRINNVIRTGANRR
jgi:hypothetical protein